MKIALTITVVIILMMIGFCVQISRDLFIEKNVSDNLDIIVQKSEWKWGSDWHLMFNDGSGYVRLYKDQDGYIICDLFVSPECRRKGYATMLLDRCDKILDGQSVSIVPKEGWMRDWYMKRGYTIIEPGSSND